VADGDCLELTHDALFRHWAHLATLIAANEDRLRRIARLEHRAAAWQAQPRDDDLLRGRTLAEAVTLSEDAAVSDAARRLLEASREADRKERTGRSERVAESAQQLRDQDRELAVALVRAAITELAPSTAANATLWGLTTTPDTSRLAIGHTTGITSIVWLPHDHRLRTADQAGRVCTWQPDGRLAAVSFAGEGELTGKTLLDPDGRYALTEQDRGAGLWRVEDGRVLASRKGGLGALFATISWGAGGRFAGQFDWDTVEVYRLADEAPKLITSLAIAHARSTAWSPRADRLAVATDEQLQVFAIAEREELILQVDVSWSAPTLSWSADGVHLAAGAAPAFNLRNFDVFRHDPRTIRVYDTDSGTVTSSSPPGLQKAMALAPDPEVIAYAVDRSQHHERVALFDLGAGKTVERRARRHAATEIAWSGEGSRIGLGSSLGDVEIWDVPSRSFRRLANGSISEIAWSPDRRQAAVSRVGTPLEIIDASGGAPQSLGGRGTHALAWSPQGGLIASSFQEQISVWDAVTGDLRAQWGRPPRRVPKRIRPWMTFPWVYALAWSGDGTRLLAWSRDFYERTDRSLTVWDAAEARRLATLAGGERSTSLLAFSPDSRFIAATLAAHDIAFWRGDDYSPAGRYQTGGSERISALAWSDDSERLALALGSQIEIWNAAEQQCQIRWVGHDEAIEHLSWSPDGLYLAGTGSHGVLSIWRAVDGRPMAVVDCPRAGVVDLHWTAQLTVTTSDGTILAWQPPAGFTAPPPTEDEGRTLSAEDRERYGLTR
jgi:WD40 repeat protein